MDMLRRLISCRIIITRHSLVRAKSEVFVLLYVFVCLFFLFGQRFLSNPRADSRQSSCGRSLGRDVTSPLLGVGGPRRAEKGANKIFVTMGVDWEFLHFGGFWAISQQRVHGSTANIICVGTMSVDVPPPLWDPSAPAGRGRGS